MTSQEDNGFAFHFKLPREGLALRSVAVQDGTPMLIFDAALKVPTLTEEDVGIACRLAAEGVRPEFYYIPILQCHPFSGRQYKHYSPEWLRGTSIGELLSEVDWSMKCLNIGAKSDGKKQRFWAWQETSQLEGLATLLDFPHESRGGSIIMSCESVEVQRKENELVFLSEPTMKINSGSSRSYSNYITDIYNSVAYYDEPLFLKIQELIKLVLAAEWLKGKEVEISQSWMRECSDRRTPSQAIEVKPKLLEENEIKEIVRAIQNKAPETYHHDFGPMSIDTKFEKSIRATGIEFKYTRTVQSSSFLAPKVEQTTTIRASSNDYNMLYSGMDPRIPIRPNIPGICEEIVPQANSWSQLFAETVPWPRVWITAKNKKVEEVKPAFSTSGGVSTSSIPVNVTQASKTTTNVPISETKRQDQYTRYSDERVSVRGQRGVVRSTKPMEGGMVPTQKVVPSPRSNVESKTDQTRANQSVDNVVQKNYGYRDEQSGETLVDDHKGKVVFEQPGYREVIEHQTTIQGVPEPTNHPPILQPLPLRGQPGQEQAEHQAQFAGATNDIPSPTSTIASKDSDYTISSDIFSGGED